ncbi:MAG: mevalonate kinase [Deltaproteobacteria bacterium]|nr:mevalonate kinase [Deltaproteobacteria bacterium]
MAERSGQGAGSAGGKLILCGEHAVVYGHPAIALGVDRRTRVHVRRMPGPTRVVTEVPPGQEERLLRAVRTVLPEGWAVAIETDLPIGQGMGSSAALAVALVRAESDARGHVPDSEEVHLRAFAVERLFHGNASGIDHAVAARGGVIRFRRTPDGPELTPLSIPPWSLVVLQSGGASDTAALVAGVSAARPAVDPTLERIGALVGEAEAVLDDMERLGPLLYENHGLLRAIGVSTPRLDALVDLAGASGAKLAGAGGGGVVIALAEDPELILSAARAHGIEAFPCRPGRSA